MNDGRVIAAFETADNQLDFNHLVVNLKGLVKGGRFQYKLKQIREIVARPRKGDPIVKYSISFTENNRSQAVALRKSGQVDFYYQMSRISTYETKEISHAEEKVMEATGIDMTLMPQDVDCSFDTTYVSFKKNKFEGFVGETNTLVRSVEN